MIDVSRLSKSYGAFPAISDLSFSVARGEMFGFLGPNGAGKTTTIRMLMGILVPSSGSILIGGQDCQRYREAANRVVGYLPEAPIFYDFLKGAEVLRFVGEMHGQDAGQARRNAARLLERFGLLEAAEEFAVNYSMGMRKKLGLACALIHEPKILILDEPTNGLDPRAAREVQKQLQEFVSAGGTIFLSTHLLDMAERLCHRLAVINHGRLAALGSIEEIRASVKAGGDLEDLFLKLTAETGEAESALPRKAP